MPMTVLSKLDILTGNWLQDARVEDLTNYLFIDDVLSIDALFDFDSLLVNGGEMSASVKNSLAYTFKYT